VKKNLVIIATAVAVMVGCASANKEQFGTAVGVAGGAAIGARLGGKTGMFIGALLGGLIAHLDEEDKKRLLELEKNALETGAGGSFVTNKTKAKVTVAASPPQMESRQDFALSSTLVPQPLVLADPVTLNAYVDTPVYNSLNERDKPKLVIQRGVPIRIAANVVDKDWAVVGEGNVGIGYVPRRYLDSTIIAAVKKKGDAQRKTGEVQSPTKVAVAQVKQKPQKESAVSESREASPAAPVMDRAQYERELASLSAASTFPSSGPSAKESTKAPSSNAPVQVVQVSTQCKVVSRKVEPNGGGAPIVEDIKYCKEPPKGWQTQTT
jgi:surface antigen